MRARIEPAAGGGEDLDIPMPAMAPAYRVGVARQKTAMDPATRRLALFAGGIGGALVLLVGIWSFTGHHHAGGVPVIEADSRPLRVKPADPGGLQIAGANDAILSGDTDGKTAMAPPPETPQPQALRAEEKAAAAEAASAAVSETPLAAKTPAVNTPGTRTEAVAEAARPQPAIPPAAVKPAEPPKPAAPAREAKVAAPVPLAPPAGKTSTRPASRASGGAVVQLAALESEEAAKAEWRRLEHRYGSLLAGHDPSFSRTVHAGKTFWRVRTGGFADAAQAELFCRRVKEKGGGCAVASF